MWDYVWSCRARRLPLQRARARAVGVAPLSKSGRMVVWWCRPLPNGSQESPERREPLLFPSPNPPKTLEPAPTEGTARWHSASPSHTHASGSYAQPHRSSVREHHRRATGTKRVSFSQSVRKASVCHHDPLLLAQCAAVCLLSADLPHPHQRELPVSLHASKSVDFRFVRCEAKVWISFWRWL